MFIVKGMAVPTSQKLSFCDVGTAIPLMYLFDSFLDLLSGYSGDFHNFRAA